MKLLIVLALMAVAAARADDNFYDTKYDSFNIDEVIGNDRLLKGYAECFTGAGKCTPEGKDFKKWLPEATTTSCGKCTEKQKVLIAKAIKAIKDKLPAEYNTLRQQNDPDNKHQDELEAFLAKYYN